MENDYILQVEGMYSKDCKQKITQALMHLPGIEVVQVDVEDGRVGVTGGGLDPHQIIDSIESLGYNAYEF